MSNKSVAVIVAVVVAIIVILILIFRKKSFPPFNYPGFDGDAVLVRDDKTLDPIPNAVVITKSTVGPHHVLQRTMPDGYSYRPLGMPRGELIELWIFEAVGYKKINTGSPPMNYHGFFTIPTSQAVGNPYIVDIRLESI